MVPKATYYAWLSDSVDSPDNRFTRSEGPYVLIDGTVIAENYADLTDESLLHPINIEVTGIKLGRQYVWTGTQSDGTSIKEWLTCNKWTADPAEDFNGMGGRTTLKNSIWSSRIARVPCNRKHRLWCFQQ